MLHLQSISQKPWNLTQLCAPNATENGIWLGVVHMWELKPDDLESSYYAKNFMYCNRNFTLIWGNHRSIWIKNAETELSWNPWIFFHQVKCYQFPIDSVVRLRSLPQDQWLHKWRRRHDTFSIQNNCQSLLNQEGNRSKFNIQTIFAWSYIPRPNRTLRGVDDPTSVDWYSTYWRRIAEHKNELSGWIPCWSLRHR